MAIVIDSDVGLGHKLVQNWTSAGDAGGTLTLSSSHEEGNIALGAASNFLRTVREQPSRNGVNVRKHWLT